MSEMLTVRSKQQHDKKITILSELKSHLSK
jgi:hypothetical protein